MSWSQLGLHRDRFAPLTRTASAETQHLAEARILLVRCANLLAGNRRHLVAFGG